MKSIRTILLLQVLILLFGCSANNPKQEASQNLTIFFVNDVHGQLDNFAKIKHIVDQERQETNVILACSGDVFSGNPVVDNYTEKGFPIIDIMNIKNRSLEVTEFSWIDLNAYPEKDAELQALVDEYSSWPELNEVIGHASFNHSSFQVGKNGTEIVIKDQNGHVIPDDYVLTVGLSDYIPAVHELYFPDNGKVQPHTTAETIITYLENNDVEVNYPQCYHYFRY